VVDIFQKVKLFKKIARISAIFLGGFAVCLLSYHYLSYNENPVKSDTIVLFVGSDDEQRLRVKEAHQLMMEGVSEVLVIPACPRIFRFKNGKIVEDRRVFNDGITFQIHPVFYENTHIEMLSAKAIMEKLNYSSAVMVSSPYHMRRIKIISKMVFKGEQWQLHFVGSRFVKFDLVGLNLAVYNMKNTISEYVKIVSFIFYSLAENVL
jgi:uncharacterized SAM-binding protein YcdF (DUF218 family)